MIEKVRMSIGLRVKVKPSAESEGERDEETVADSDCHWRRLTFDKAVESWEGE